MRRMLTGWLLTAGLVAGCGDGGRDRTSVCALVDLSGTYSQAAGPAFRMLKTGVLPHLLPGDSLFVIAIDGDSYHQDNLLARLDLGFRPSQVHSEKLAFAHQLDRLAAAPAQARYTDITGAMMLCADYLRGAEADARIILVASDLKEELPEGLHRDLPGDELAGLMVAALHVIRLRSDNADPAEYRGRLRAWEERVRQGGAAGWSVLVDPRQIPAFIARRGVG